MNKKTLKRLSLSLLQHCIAAGIMAAVAVILFNSYIGFESMQESQTLWMDPIDTEPVFEDTEVYKKLVKTTVSDIIYYVALRAQMETGGQFDLTKKIDVTEYANQGNTVTNCDVTAFYALEDLIKWGKSEVTYIDRAMNISDFVNYFGNACSPENFALDDDGRLYFAGFLDGSFTPNLGREIEDKLQYYEEDEPDDEKSDVEKMMLRYTTEQLESMAFSYIMSENLDEITVTQEEDGTLTVHVTMVSFKYESVNGLRQLTEYAGNWIEYCFLQRNLVTSIEKLTEGYELYLKGKELYSQDKTNFVYVIRTKSEEGIVRTYTNNAELTYTSDDDLADDFSEYRRYFVYYRDNLEFTGITVLEEGDIFRYMNYTAYDFPESTRIWMALDTTYEIHGDAFYDAHALFEKIVPNILKLITIIMVLVFMWLGIFLYITGIAGVAYDENGEKCYYTTFVDKLWTEFLFVAGGLLIYVGYRSSDVLTEVANMVYSSHSELLGMNMTKLYEYGTFGLFGAGVSFAVDILWFSLVRRARNSIIVRGSFLYWLLLNVKKIWRFIFSHKNSAISTLIPYNLFLLVNISGAFVVYRSIENKSFTGAVVCALIIVVLDGLVGVMIFRNSAERKDIVDGIKKIREGEVDYKLEVDSLTEINREMADAVNNIGEGIKKAVDTSIKDEQMKSDLITNVSHDIKTPLTSIINYVDLLKRLKINDEPAKSYIEVLDGKAQRLKQLTDDLVEASKISSGNIELNMEKINITELLNQNIGEFSEKLEERGLVTIFENNNVPVYIYADSRRMWRIIDNLFNNIYKYALENTRVYIEAELSGGFVCVTIKNISARQMNMKGDELTERFIRGDSARATEGSGLGLFIAKSLAQVQGGSFEIRLDADLFKVLLVFPQYEEKLPVPE